LIEANTYYKLS